MGTSGTESCEGCLQTQFKHLPPQLALKSNLVRLQSVQTSKEVYELRDGPLFLLGGGGGGGYLFHKKLFTSCSWLKTNCLLQGYEGKKLSAKEREIF